MISGREFDRVRARLKALFDLSKISYTITYCRPTDNSAMRLDFDSDRHIGRITLWESGACTIEILEIYSEESAFCEYCHCNSFSST
jgi:hypothetical protein